jgi:hypothetical protein
MGDVARSEKEKCLAIGWHGSPRLTANWARSAPTANAASRENDLLISRAYWDMTRDAAVSENKRAGVMHDRNALLQGAIAIETQRRALSFDAEMLNAADQLQRAAFALAVATQQKEKQKLLTGGEK